MRAIRTAAWAIAIIQYATVALGAFDVGGARGWIPLPVFPFLAVSFLTPVTVGLLIVRRQPRNAIAWILLAGPLPILLTVLVSIPLDEGWSLQIDRASWPFLYAWPIAVAYVFPTGHLLTSRWRWVARGAVLSFVGFTTLAMLYAGPFEGEDAAVPNPVADSSVARWVEDAGLSWIGIALWGGMLASLVAGVVAMILRLRRSSGVERLQAMWLAWSVVLIPLTLALCGLSSWMLGESFVGYVVFPLILLFQFAVAVSVGIAVLRYRLYAIELLVNRTVVYAALTTVLLATYAVVSVGLGVVIGGDSRWVVAAATLVVALGFRPVRARIQDLVDRRFRRARYEGVLRVRAFEDEVRDGLRAPEEIGEVVADALDDPRAELFFWLPESEAFADVRGAVVGRLPVDGRSEREILRDEARTAILLHDPVLCERRDLLDGVLAAAALSIEMARLRVEVRLQLAEVQASRVRIVEAGYEERRRLERDLHDGAQQRLVSLGMRLRRMQRSLPGEAQVLAPAFDQVVDEVGSAIRDLRQIAAGVRPARLDDGLAAALDDLARDVPIPVEVDARVPRVAASVEAAAYFVACEALTNAVKHASASRVAVSAVRERGAVRVSVADDGVGGAVARRGSGLAGLRDRVSAHGGTLEIVSPPGGGTRIEVALPCES